MKYVPPLGSSGADAGYTNGNPETGNRGSVVPAAGIEHPQREIVNAILAAGLIPDPGDLTQLRQSINLLAASGRACQSWTVTKDIAEGGVLTLPDKTAYTVGAGALLLACDGVLLDAENIEELGAQGATSKTVKLLFAAPAGTRFFAALTAPVGGLTVDAVPSELLTRLADAITRAENAAALADAARVALGDPLFVAQQE